MKKTTMVMLLLILVMGLLFSEASYSSIDPLSLPTYTYTCTVFTPICACDSPPPGSCLAKSFF